MPIRLPRTTLPALPQQPQLGAQPIAGATVAPVGNATEVLADGAQAAAGLAARLFQQQREQEVMTRVAELDIQRRQADGELLAAYSTLQGKDAVEKRGEMMQRLEANSRRLRDGIKDATVAQVWARQDAALSLSSTQQLDSHYRRENIRWQADTQASRAELLVQDLGRVAFGEGYDPATGRLSAEAERTRSAYLDAVNNLGQLNGWSAERIEVEQRKADNAAIGQVAQQLLDEERLDEAGALLEAQGDRIDLQTKQKLRREQQRRKDDRQAFDAARWAEQQPGNLVEQIEALNRYVEGGAMSLEVRDAAEQRLRAAESLQWQERMRAGNEALGQMEQYAQLNRTATYDDLPMQMRQQLEESGRDTAARNWFQQGGQFVTTTEGMDFMLRMDDDALLRATREELQAARMFLSPGDLSSMLNRWDRLRGAVVKASAGAGNLPDGLIEESITTRMQDLGMLKVDAAATPEDVNRRKRLVFEVKKMAAMRPNDDPQKLIEEALQDTLYVDNRELPTLAYTLDERNTGEYRAGNARLKFEQLNPEVYKAALARRVEENNKRMQQNRDWEKAGDPRRVPLLPTERGSVIGDLVTSRASAVQRAKNWLNESMRNPAMKAENAWHQLPADLRTELEATGASDMVRTEWVRRNYRPPTYGPQGGGAAGRGLFRIG